MTFWRWTARRTNVSIVSNRNGHTTRANGSRPIGGCAVTGAASGAAAMRKPRKALPTSPMKIVAGAQLCGRKPRQAAASARPRSIAAGAPRSQPSAAMAAPATAP